MKNLLLIITLLLAGCASKQSVLKTEIEENNLSALEITVENEENVLFTIRNNTEETIFINQPTILNIEKLNEGSWQKLRILPCPCDAPCAAPREKDELSPGELIKLTWNKEESWCGTERVNMVRNTVKQKVINGTYRIRINLFMKQNNLNTIYKEFMIN